MCTSMSTQQIAIFGDKLMVQRETLRWKLRDLALGCATVARREHDFIHLEWTQSP